MQTITRTIIIPELEKKIVQGFAQRVWQSIKSAQIHEDQGFRIAIAGDSVLIKMDDGTRYSESKFEVTIITKRKSKSTCSGIDQGSLYNKNCVENFSKSNTIDLLGCSTGAGRSSDLQWRVTRRIIGDSLCSGISDFLPPKLNSTCVRLILVADTVPEVRGIFGFGAAAWPNSICFVIFWLGGVLSILGSLS